MPAFQPCERRRRGAEYATTALLVRSIELFAQFKTIVAHATQVRSVDQHASERDERRIRMILAVMDLFVVEAFVILGARVAQRVVIRMIGLNQHLPRSIATSRASRDLRDQLKRSLSGTKVTFGKSCPFASICVPTSISIFPSLKSLSVCSKTRRRAVVSRSMRATRSAGKSCVSISSICSVPSPT